MKDTKETLELVKNVEELVDRGTGAIADVHKQIARLPFDAAEQIPGLAEPARRVRKVHDAVVDLVYGSVRKINRAVCNAIEVIATPARAGPPPTTAEAAPLITTEPQVTPSVEVVPPTPLEKPVATAV